MLLASDIAPIKETVPEHMICNLVFQFDAENAANIIIKVSNDSFYCNSLKCKNWAIDRYDADKLFKKLKTQLGG